MGKETSSTSVVPRRQVRLTENPPSTPRDRQRPAHLQETPRSGDEVFMDALTSPPPQTPRRTTRATKDNKAKRSDEPPADASFEASEIDESGMLKLVVELDSTNVNPTEYRVPVASPWRKFMMPSLSAALPRKVDEAARGRSSLVRSDLRFLPARLRSPKPRPLSKRFAGPRRSEREELRIRRGLAVARGTSRKSRASRQMRRPRSRMPSSKRRPSALLPESRSIQHGKSRRISRLVLSAQGRWGMLWMLRSLLTLHPTTVSTVQRETGPRHLCPLEPGTLSC